MHSDLTAVIERAGPPFTKTVGALVDDRRTGVVRVESVNTAAPLLADQGGNSMQTERKYWFPAKRFGWGWGIPRSWPGWLVLAVFVGLLSVGSFLFPPGTELGPYIAYVAVLCGLLIGVCWLKGEPPRWRWGNDER